jgi:hypothetical protein
MSYGTSERNSSRVISKGRHPKASKVMLPKSGSFNPADFDDVVASFGDTAAIE